MRKIKLLNGRVALVDNEDYSKVKQYKWRFLYNNFKKDKDSGYAVSGFRPIILMHRLILETPVGLFTDHINNNKLDNRRKNLRIVTRQQNATNRLKFKNKSTSSIFKGVSKEKEQDVYRVSVVVEKKIVKINGFKNEHYAALAYDLWANDLYGQYANLNFKRAI